MRRRKSITAYAAEGAILIILLIMSLIMGGIVEYGAIAMLGIDDSAAKICGACGAGICFVWFMNKD